MYDYHFVKEGLGKWVPWSDSLQNLPDIPKNAQFNSIIVPTEDTIRYTYLMDLLVKHEKPCLFVGPTGTGKSVYIQVSAYFLKHNVVEVFSGVQHTLYSYFLCRISF